MRITSKKKKPLMLLPVERLQMKWLCKIFLSNITEKPSKWILAKLRIRWAIVLWIVLVGLVVGLKREEEKLEKQKRQKKLKQKSQLKLTIWMQSKEEKRKRRLHLKLNKKWGKKRKMFQLKKKFKKMSKKKRHLRQKLKGRQRKKQRRRRVQQLVLEHKKKQRKDFIAKWNNGSKIWKRRTLKWQADLVISKRFGLRLSQIQIEQSQIEWPKGERWLRCKRKQKH